MTHPMNRPECQIDTPHTDYEPTPQDLAEAADYFDSLEVDEDPPQDMSWEWEHMDY